jgi:glycerate 2-kinase
LSDDVFCVAAGKAAEPMARAAAHVLGSRLRSGVIAAPSPSPIPPFELFAAAHPLPDAASERAGRRALALAARARASGADLLVLLSGGASSLLAVPGEGVSLDDKRCVGRELMAAGTAVVALNCVRRHLSAIKGGRLAAAAGRSLTLAISDVHAPPDDPATIASGPTVPDPSTFADALDVIARAGVAVPPSVRAYLDAGMAGAREETLKPGHPALARSQFLVIANRHTAVRGAEAEAARRHFIVRVLPAATSGEARAAGRDFASRAVQIATQAAHPVCVIGSGEPTVTVRGTGHGGRNQEFVLGAADVLAHAAMDVVLGSAGTDGIDGPTSAAGAAAGRHTLARATALGFSVATTLANNNAHALLDALGDLIVWGPTQTNVGDVHVFLASGDRTAG